MAGTMDKGTAPAPAPQAPVRHPRRWPWALAAAVIALGAGIGIGSAASSTATKTVIQYKTVPGPTVTVPGPTVTVTVPASPAPTVTVTKTAAPSQPSASAGANQIIIRFGGTGTQNTASFTTPGNWHLSWAYWGCPGGRSNFIVDEYNADGTTDFNGISVNELGTGRGPVATHAYGDAGTHYLSVNTEGCSWSLVPVTG